MLRNIFATMTLCLVWTIGALAVPGHVRAPEPFAAKHAPGTIVVKVKQRRLYFVIRRGEAISYPVGTARPGIQFYGRTVVTTKRVRPTWVPTRNQRKLYRGLPGSVGPGPANPLGTRALTLARANLRIHGTNEPHTIGQAMSDGCIRMYNRHIEQLFKLVKVGARVIVER